ncbi:hypothetical protein FACS189487_00990 [Campylobacterota bacterium]|nr:hypothetical protein FACS189487_00990 [Campylobacterota bacterium]
MVTPITQSQVGQVVTSNLNPKSEVKTNESQKTESRVDEIKAGLAQGTYKFDIGKTAQSVADELL